MQAGTLNLQIRVENPVYNKNAYGSDSIRWETSIAKTRAAVTFNNSNRANENNEIIFTYQVTFTVRIYHQIDERMRIIWKNKKYRILSIEYNQKKQLQIIRTELINE